MCCRYRDTKMEIQGLSAAQNLQRQHGVSCRADLSRPGRRTGASCRTTPSDIGAADGLVLHEPESDDNNSGSRPGTSPFLLQENGSGGGPPAPERSNKNNTGARCVDAGLGLLVGLRGKGVGRHRPRRGCPDTGKRCGLEHGEGGLQMAFPVDLQQGSQQRPRCQPDRNPGLEESAAGPRAVTGCSAHIDGGAEEELFVVFNVARGGEGVASKEADSPDAVRSAAAEVQDASGRVRPGVSSVHLPPRNARKSRPTGAPPRSRPVGRCDVGVTPLRRGPEPETGEGDDDGDGGAMASRCSAERDGSEGDAGAIERIHTGQPGRSAAGDSAPFVEALPLSDGGSAHLSGGCIATGSANVTQSDDAFSGTITINNQSIVVTIENGVLTLAAPSEGHSQREDCSSLFSLKEHLGLKEHQDVVLISYDGTTKPAGRNGNATMGCVQYEESRTCLPVSDPGLALEEDCSFSDPGSVLADVHGSKEDGAFCALAQGDAVDSGSKDGTHGELMACDGLPSTKLGGCAGMVPKKGAPASYRCPQSDCGRTFDAKHKLKMHVLSHAEDQRPFKCPVEGCGWSFTTSYKLKRHLQSHDKARPFACEWENCGRRFTTVYNLKAHARAHGREGAFVCSTCSERFRSAARLGSHQRSHFEPERPHRCEFPGCEKTFITFSALFSHNRTHFRETGQFICNYPGCDKRYDKACRLKIHLRSHTGERPFVCDSEGCGWSFTSMSKLLRHKRKHEDDRRFICQQEGCGKSFTRAEHLKGHSITHLGTKPFECPVEGCTAKFSARSSLYIHSKKHQVDRPLRSRCPVSSCSKCFSSRGSLKSHMMKHHNLSPDLLSQLEMSTSLTPSSELTSTGPAAGDMDLGSLFSGGGTGVAGVPGTGGASALTMDMSLVSSGILTIDAASVSATLGGAGGALAQAVDPLILAAGAEVGPAGFDAGAGSVLPQGALNLEDVQTVNPEALGSLAALALRPPTGSEHLHALSSTSALASDPPAPLAPSSSLATSSGSGLLSAASEPDQGGRGGALLGGTDVLSQQEGSKVVTQFVFPGHGGSFSAQKDPELHAVPACSFLESGGSARTDYRAIQLAKKKKQKGPAGAPGSSVGQRKSKGGKGGGSSVMPGAPAGGRFSESVASASGGLTLRDPVTGAQYVQIQLLQDDPSGDGDLAFQLSSQTSSSHSQLTVDLPVNILQEPPVTAEDDTGSETSQFTGSTINLQDLE